MVFGILLIFCSVGLVDAGVYSSEQLHKDTQEISEIGKNDPLLLSKKMVQNEIYHLENFNIEVDAQNNEIIISKYEKIVFQTMSSNFLRFGNSSVKNPPIVNGNYQLEEEILWISTLQTIEKVEMVTTQQDLVDETTEVKEDQEMLQITGKLFLDDLLEVEYLLSFTLSTESTNQLSFLAKLTSPTTLSSDFNRLYLSYQTNSEETFHGFGESFTNFNLKGRRIPILVSEQGVGRGLQPITDDLNNGTEGVGGHWYTTYAPKPLYLTNQNRSMLYENSEVMFIDLTDPLAVVAEVWSTELRGNIIYGTTMRELLFEITIYTGRMIPPPEWSQLGAVVGLEGGTDSVTAIVELMQSYDIPLAGIWLQDWVGLRHSYDGDRLIWNWEVNPEWYPNWNAMVKSWHDRGTRVLTYLNPFFSDPTNYTNTSRHNFVQDGLQNHYFIYNSITSEPYLMSSLSIDFYMLDLTNPAAVLWMKQIIRNYTISEAMSSGWMADFGEYLPFDAKLFSGVSAAEYHNVYPQDWARLNIEILQEMNLTTEILYFMRSAWIQSPRYNSIFWEGDQLVSWDEFDGMKSVILGALASGLCGHTISHSDIGGYNVNYDYGYVRDEEILSRWTELSTFGSGLLRTHIGSSTDSKNFQVYESDSSLLHFKKFTKIYSELSQYRNTLIQEAVTKGLPLIRPYAMNYAYDSHSWTIEAAYLFGDEFLVSPTMDPGATSVEVYFPPLSGNWIHLWGGNVVHSSSSAGKVITVPAGMGFPAVFYQEDSLYGNSLRSYLISNGYTEGYSWNYDDSKGKGNDKKDISQTLLAIILSFGALFLVLTIAGIVWITRSSSSSSSSFASVGRGIGEGDARYVPPSDPIYTPLTSEDPGMSMKATGVEEQEEFHRSILAENLS